MGINHIALLGHVAQAPEHRMTPSGVAMTTFQIAVSRRAGKDGATEITDYVRVVTWRQEAERIASLLQKGMLVTLEGRLSTRSFEKDGQRRKIVEIEATSVEPVGGAPAHAEAGLAEDGFDFDQDFDESAMMAPPAPRAAAAPAARQAPPAPPARPAAPPPDFDDDIPF